MAGSHRGEVHLNLREHGSSQPGPDAGDDDVGADKPAGRDTDGGRGRTGRSSAPVRSARPSEPREWHVSERKWRRNRELAEHLTVTRVAQRLEAEKQEAARARQLSAMAALRFAVQREADPSEWKVGERRWRHHQAQVQSSVQAKTAVSCGQELRVSLSWQFPASRSLPIH